MVSSEITAIGMGIVTPVGHNAKQSCASINAGISRFEESDEFLISDDRGRKMPVVIAAINGLTDGQRRFLRLFRMAFRAFYEAVQTSGIGPADLPKTGMYLCLPEDGRPGLDNRAEQILVKKLSLSIDVDDLTPQCKIFNIGHAGVFHAIQEAVKDFAQDRYHTAIVGAVDTYIDRVTLQWLKEMNWLKTEDHSDGFIPGEGAAFIVLKQKKDISLKNKLHDVTIGGVETSMEENSIYEKSACRGDGLSDTISATLAHLDSYNAVADLVICDLNGQRYRSLEWGVSIPRAFVNHSIPSETLATATCIGNAGAASGLINICHGLKSLEKAYTQSGSILVWGGSDDGQRGSLYLRRVE